MSLNQYPNMVTLVQVLWDMGVTSQSALVHVPSGENVDDSFGSCQPERVDFSLIAVWAREARDLRLLCIIVLIFRLYRSL